MQKQSWLTINHTTQVKIEVYLVQTANLHHEICTAFTQTCNKPRYQRFSPNIYHTLPEISRDIESITTIFMRADDISDNHQLKALCETPRRQQRDLRSVKKGAGWSMLRSCRTYRVDLLQSSEIIVIQWGRMGVVGDYVFYFAYPQPTHSHGRRSGLEYRRASRCKQYVAIQITWLKYLPS